MIALDLFAGAGGWSVALQRMGIQEYGVEIALDARRTRYAAGFDTSWYDVWEGLENPRIVPDHDILIASPPCQTFSLAGGGGGRKNLDQVLDLVQKAWDEPFSLEYSAPGMDERTTLVLSPLAYASAFRPDLIALEQVPSVLPVWEAIGAVLEEAGYSVFTGVLNASDYGVPQSRNRAVLLARADGRAVSAPEKAGASVTMQEAIGWGFTKRPSHTLTSHLGVTRSPTGTQKMYRQAIEAGEFIFKPVEPKPSKIARNGIGSEYAPNTINISTTEGAMLQTFPADHPFQGTKTSRDLQVGNAIPPLFAEALLKELLD